MATVSVKGLDSGAMTDIHTYTAICC